MIRLYKKYGQWYLQSLRFSISRPLNILAAFAVVAGLSDTKSRVINLSLTTFARNRTGRISVLGLFCTDLAEAARSILPIPWADVPQYGPWTLGYIYHATIYPIALSRLQMTKIVSFFEKSSPGVISVSRCFIVLDKTTPASSRNCQTALQTAPCRTL